MLTFTATPGRLQTTPCHLLGSHHRSVLLAALLMACSTKAPPCDPAASNSDCSTLTVDGGLDVLPDRGTTDSLAPDATPHTADAGTDAAFPCAAGQAACGQPAVCVDVLSSAGNCGVCGRSCSAGQTCQSGRCAVATQCAVGSHDCAGVCVSSSSIASCGSACEPCALATNAAEMRCDGICQVARCLAGYALDAGECEDIDECAAGNNCDRNATCTNSPGSFACACTPPYVGSGVVCAAPGMWRRLNPSTEPRGLDGARMAYDVARRTTVLFGGFRNGLQDETWLWSGTNWRQVSGRAPRARNFHAMAYDAAREQVVMFGGANGERLADTWLWNGSGWTQATPGTSPDARNDAAMVYDSARQQVMLFGGFNGTRQFNDTWLWDGTTWTRVFPPHAPSVRSASSMAFDAARGRVVLFGGRTLSMEFNDTWTWDGTDWTQVIARTAPLVRAWHSMAYDAGREQIVLFGGVGAERLGDTWTWNGSVWTQNAGPGPSARYRHACAYHEANGHMVLFGGIGPDTLRETWTWQ